MRWVWLVGLVLGCGDDAAPCTNDVDCPAFHRCMSGGCQPLPARDAGERDANTTRHDGGAPDATPLDAPGSAGTGRLYVIGTDGASVPEVQWRFFGDFIPAGADCTTEVTGICTYRECAAGTVLPAAGRITLSSGAAAFEVSPETTGRYRAAGTMPLWADESEVTVSAKGDEVPGFAAMSTPQPTPLAAVALVSGAPLEDSLMGGTFRRLGDVYLEVEPPATERALILVDLAGGEVVRELRCAFRPGFTDLTIPAAELQRLPPTTLALVAIVAVTSGEAPVAGWSTRVETMTVATLGSTMAIGQMSVE